MTEPEEEDGLKAWSKFFADVVKNDDKDMARKYSKYFVLAPVHTVRFDETTDKPIVTTVEEGRVAWRQFNPAGMSREDWAARDRLADKAQDSLLGLLDD